MHTAECLEALLQNELRHLCLDCVYAGCCSYRTSTEKIIIQCESHVAGGHAGVVHTTPAVSQGLCGSCSQANFCRLPGRHVGVFHCADYA